MPTLLSLSNEILDYIIDGLHIDDIEAFSSCCKHVRSLAAARLGEHLAKKFAFPTVAIEPEDVYEDNLDSDDYDDTETRLIPSRLLQDFLIDEKNALYPRSITIRGIGKRRNDNEEMLRALLTTYLDQHEGLEDKIAAKVMQIRQSLIPSMTAVAAQRWIDHIKKGESDSTAAFPINLFPNVKTLRVKNCPSLPKTLLFTMLENLTSSAAMPDSPASYALKELSEVDLRGSGHRSLDGNLFPMFLRLPSMRVIKGYKVDWPAGDWPSYGPVISSIKELSFDFSQIAFEQLIDCIRTTKTLERFTYDMVLTYSSTITWEPRLIVRMLRLYAWETLVHLELTGDPRGLSSNLAGGEPFIGTLRFFQSLESIRLMSMMLFRPVDGRDIDESEDGLESVLDDTTDESEDDIKSAVEDTIDDPSLVEPRRLVDFLPASAKKLELVGGISDEEARDMFADLPRLKRERVPELAEVVLEDSDPLERETKDLCRNSGVRLTSVE